MMINDKLPNLFQVLRNFGNQLTRLWMLLLDLLENFDRRFFWIDDFGGVRENFLFLFQMLETNRENLVRRQIDQLHTREHFLILRRPEREVGGGFRQSFLG